jgi:two-component system cell cycle sensor histidine kinase/response regulator CckA
MIMDALEEDNPLRKDAEQVLTAGQRAAKLTRQLLAFSRRQNLEPVVLDINHLTEGILKMLQRIIGEDIELECVLTPDLWSVRVDPGQIEQVLMNLAVNARDAMPLGGKLTIETDNMVLSEDYADEHGHVRPGSYVMLAVSDTGCGIPKDVMDYIFDPFFTTKETGKGTGLGLAMVYGTVKQHGGNIWVYSEPGRGTTVKIYLPWAAVGGELPPVPAPSGRTRGTETILLVEDEEAVRSLVERVLTGQGYRVLAASDPREAKELFERHGNGIALLLTDVVMPGSDGPELYAQLRECRPMLRVLYMSGYTESKFVRHGFREAEAGFIQKPFSPEALAGKVREVLDASSTDLS